MDRSVCAWAVPGPTAAMATTAASRVRVFLKRVMCPPFSGATYIRTSGTRRWFLSWTGRTVRNWLAIDEEAGQYLQLLRSAPGGAVLSILSTAFGMNI